MKKLFICIIVIAVAGLWTAGLSFAEETAAWAPNNPRIAIYNEAVEAGFYTMEYDNIRAEQISKTENIRLLMIDGGFAPNPDVIIENSRTLVPIRLVSEILGAEVNWSEKDKLVTIKEGGIEIKLSIGSNTALVNGSDITLDSPAAIFNASTYVPLRFIADSFEADVGYIPQLTYGLDYTGENAEYWIRAREKVSLVVIEKGNKTDRIFSVEEGLAAVREASVQEYEGILGYLKVDGDRNISESGRGDYDSQAVTYAGYDIGRYYVYTLEKFEEHPVFFNKYTGEIFGESTGLPFVFWNTGFPRISFMYQ